MSDATEFVILSKKLYARIVCHSLAHCLSAQRFCAGQKPSLLNASAHVVAGAQWFDLRVVGLLLKWLH